MGPVNFFLPKTLFRRDVNRFKKYIVCTIKQAEDDIISCEDDILCGTELCL